MWVLGLVKRLEFFTLHGLPILSNMRNLLSHDTIRSGPSHRARARRLNRGVIPETARRLREVVSGMVDVTTQQTYASASVHPPCIVEACLILQL
jgi:hypothetical protein